MGRNLLAASHLDPSASPICSHMQQLTLKLLPCQTCHVQVSLFFFYSRLILFFTQENVKMHRKMYISGFLENLMDLFWHFRIFFLNHNPSFPSGFIIYFLFCFVSGFCSLLIAQFSFPRRVLEHVQIKWEPLESSG